MKYFIKVNTYLATTKLGCAMRDYIYAKYQSSLVNESQLQEIPLEIEKVMAEKLGENRRLKPMEIKVNGMKLTSSGFKIKRGAEVYIALRSPSPGMEEKLAFSIYAHPVSIDFTERAKNKQSTPQTV